MSEKWVVDYSVLVTSSKGHNFLLLVPVKPANDSSAEECESYTAHSQTVICILKKTLSIDRLTKVFF